MDRVFGPASADRREILAKVDIYRGQPLSKALELLPDSFGEARSRPRSDITPKVSRTEMAELNVRNRKIRHRSSKTPCIYT